MVMRGQWVNGAVMTADPGTKASCSCDGQYSENRACRKFDPYFLSTTSPLSIPGVDDGDGNGGGGGKDSGLCSNLVTSLNKTDTTDSHVHTFKQGKDSWPAPFSWDQINCTDPDYRGVFLMVQAGLHYGTDADRTFKEVVEPILRHPTYETCVELDKVKIVFASMTAQSRSMDQRYSHQSRENSNLFNEKIQDMIQSSGAPGSGDVMFLNWLNLTADAQTSDGLHSLMDVNLSKVSHLLYLLEMLSTG
eukprot:CAMPEP_0197249198 /NCGR_PEP_ID=MMETSP1429-20130617/45680_1 /TAXON_ID=49237 /ORGANISM="Chaetoceros  sp., Strain UNC1202" /LENGTH=247 /DNA_ID=CAMNT_0042710649 /DNA_START=262 /DNA_END=1005 /DNA_ORIENTATION=+